MLRKRIFDSRSWISTLRLLILILVSIMFFKLMDNSDALYQGIGSKIHGLVSTVTPFVYAALIAYIISPIVDTFEKYVITRTALNKLSDGRRRLISTLIVYTLIIYLIVSGTVYVLPEVVESILELLEDAPAVFKSLEQQLIELNNNVNSENADIISIKVAETLTGVFDAIANRATEILNTILLGALDFTAKTVVIVFSVIVSIYLVISKNHWRRSIRKVVEALFGRKVAVKYDLFWRDMNRTFIKFVLGKAIASLILGIICFIGLIIIKSPYAVLISVIFAITNMIPYFGPFLGELIGGILVALVNPFLGMIVFFYLLGLQQVDAFLLTPKLVGDALKISPVWIMFAILLGGKLFGLPGMFFGAPLMAVIVEIVNHRLEKRLAE